MKKKKRNHFCNQNSSKVGDACKSCNSSSTSNFAKNKSTITDNEYEVTSESNSMNNMNKKKRSK